MICPSCKAKIADHVKRCPYCDGEISSQVRTRSGRLGFTLAVSAVIGVIIAVELAFLVGFAAFFVVILLFFVVMMLSIIAVVFSAVTYFKKSKEVYVLAALVIGISLLVITPVVASFCTWKMSRDHYELEYLHDIVFSADHFQNTISVVSVGSPTIPWDDIDISGVYETKPTGKYVEAGDKITGCQGRVTIWYRDTEWRFQF